MISGQQLKDLDVVIIFKNQGDEELRYCLRSIEKNLPHRNIILSGDKPVWATNVTHIPLKSTQRPKTCWEDQAFKIYNACRDDRVSDNFVFFNDDFFCLKPVKQLPNFYLDTLLEDVLRRSKLHQMNNKYIVGMRNTHKLLKDKGIEVPLSYELHLPMVIRKYRWIDVYDMLKGKLTKNNSPVFHRSVYGNMFYDDNQQREDVKYIKTDDDYPRGTDYLSTLNTRFDNTPVGLYIKDQFPEKSRFEL